MYNLVVKLALILIINTIGLNITQAADWIFDSVENKNTLSYVGKSSTVITKNLWATKISEDGSQNWMIEKK